MSSSPESLPPGWEKTMSSSPETLQAGWDGGAASSPESFPPGFENPNAASPPTENPVNSLGSPSSPIPQENTVKCPFLSPSPSPPPREVQNNGNTSSSNRSPPQKKHGALPSPSPQQHREIPDSAPHSVTKSEEDQGPSTSMDLPQGSIGSLHPLPMQPVQEMGQMVCGSCNELLSYPRGSKHIQCACCQTINFVLEAHQVGLANCGNCCLLLMYPYGAKSIRCSSCHSVTEMLPHSIRPPVSVLQGFPAPPQNAVH
ncbi:hypothetical protein HPP92_027869 [Vanilla planifolia]|uniref:Zinc finger LSD1-type domain-containing protein n=2 Tax=Vanilla planifolia TaxID=51239 RepID=A0A835U3P4_VANPL|nr:hypothetical protein HPP92_027869 [Vanilla planifolia]